MRLIAHRLECDGLSVDEQFHLATKEGSYLHYQSSSKDFKMSSDTTYPKRTNSVGKLCLDSTSLIRRDANDPRESLPMPGMRAAPAGADFCRVRLGEAEG